MTGFVLVSLAAALVGWAVSRLTRDITFFGANTDNALQARAAARLRLGDWPSSIHALTYSRAPMKVFFVLMLAPVQRLLRDRDGERPLVVLCILSNCLSAVLVFLVAQAYWGPRAAYLGALLFLLSLWPWQLALHGGPICLSLTCFLASVFLVQQAAEGGSSFLVWYALAGLAASLTQFSSSSARKFLPLFAAAFFWSQRGAFSLRAPKAQWTEPDVIGLSILTGLAVLGLALVVVGWRRRGIVEAACDGRGPRWLRGVVAVTGQVDLDRHQRRAGELVWVAGKWWAIVTVYVLGCLALSPEPTFYAAQAVVVAGFAVGGLWLTYPDVLKNLRLYFSFVNASKRQLTRFPVYRAFFERSGTPIPPEMRGAGLRWVVRYFRRIAPVESGLYVIAVSLLAAVTAIEGARPAEIARLAGLVVLSVSPIAVAELTGAPQIGRTYFPGLVGLLIAITAAASRLSERGGDGVFLPVAIAVIGLTAGWNGRVFLTDVWPARMAPAWLAWTLRERGITTFYTYDSPYNDALVGSLPRHVRERFHIRFITDLRDVREGYVVVPGTSAKAFNMESQQYAIEHGDFDEDGLLTELLRSRAIERYAVASFETFGTSRIWAQESEVTSYRDLILRDIGEEDRWRGRAWILDAGRMRADLAGVAGARSRVGVT